jgi:hypothetical protein
MGGTMDWMQKSYSISGSGTHTLMWEYEKDSGDSNGSGYGWVDYLTRTGETSPADRQTAESVCDPSGRRIEKKFDGQFEVKCGVACPAPGEPSADAFGAFSGAGVLFDAGGGLGYGDGAGAASPGVLARTRIRSLERPC